MGVALTQGLSGFASNMAAQRQAQAAQQQYAMEKGVEWQLSKMRANDEARMRAAAGVINMNQLTVRQQEINEAAAEDKREIDIAAMRAKASAELNASEAGVTGNTVKRLLNSITSEATHRKNNVETTRSNQVMAAQLEKHGVKQAATVQPVYGVLPSSGGGSMSYLAAAVAGLGSASPYLDITGMFNKKSQTSSTVVKNPLLG